MVVLDYACSVGVVFFEKLISFFSSELKDTYTSLSVLAAFLPAQKKDNPF